MAEENYIDEKTMRTIKHDIKNQLSNILLLAEQLKYEVPDTNPDCLMYIDMISASTKKIDEILNSNSWFNALLLKLFGINFLYQVIF